MNLQQDDMFFTTDTISILDTYKNALQFDVHYSKLAPDDAFTFCKAKFPTVGFNVHLTRSAIHQRCKVGKYQIINRPY
jgi:hypothetical protein